MTSEIESQTLYLDIEKVLRPVAPLLEFFRSYQFISSYVSDQSLLSLLISYYESFDDVNNEYNRLKAIGKLNSYSTSRQILNFTKYQLIDKRLVDEFETKWTDDSSKSHVLERLE